MRYEADKAVAAPRVCMICDPFPPVYGGSGAQALYLAQKLTERSVSVSVLTSRRHADLPVRESFAGVAVCRLPVMRTDRLRVPSFSLSAAWYLLRHPQDQDLIHVHGAYWRILPILGSARLTKKRSLVKMTLLGTDDPQAIRQRRWGRLLNQTLALADVVISTSRELSASYASTLLPPEKLVEIPNGVDADLFCPPDGHQRARLKAQFNLPPDAPVVLFVGQVGHRKGTDLLLQAWALVSNRVPDAWLVLVGPRGEDFALPEGTPPLEHWLSRVSRTLVLGQQAGVPDYLRAADIFVLPSRMEGLPNALMEAMATGLPCIASDIGGNVDLIEDGGNGLLFELGNIQQLADRLLQLLQDPAQRLELGRRARQTIEAEYSLDAVADQYVALYRRLLENDG